MQFRFSTIFILFTIFKSAHSNITNINLPEYREYVLRNHIARINPTTNAPQFTLEFITNSTMDPISIVQLPSLCKEIETLSIPQIFVYCLALLALWLMAMFTTMLYQLRAIISLKQLINSSNFGKDIKDKDGHDTNKQNFDAKSTNSEKLQGMRASGYDPKDGFELNILSGN